ncbi:hypothetical protein MPH_04096 [Macrophomina phaseolina MS6]|uniref:Uncharacterized protein n=1 Tax=Macrophomina phaseolina (strain MS6) TaxID=1126212 RepID=K2RV16_MACPH|nr:hypothetical protein MPH_04096 [Macrophomina phaseolina MS6]
MGMVVAEAASALILQGANEGGARQLTAAWEGRMGVYRSAGQGRPSTEGGFTALGRAVTASPKNRDGTRCRQSFLSADRLCISKAGQSDEANRGMSKCRGRLGPPVKMLQRRALAATGWANQELRFIGLRPLWCCFACVTASADREPVARKGVPRLAMTTCCAAC